MSEIELLVEAVASALDRVPDADTGWARIEEGGFASAAVLAGLPEAAAIVRTAAGFPVALPLTETALLATTLLAECGLDVPEGKLTVATSSTLRLELTDGRWALDGTASRVPWARCADHVVVLAGAHVACVPGGAADVEPGENLAGEPRDDLTFDDVEVPAALVAPAPISQDELFTRGALARSVSMVGALERVLELTVQYAGEREQFGQRIGRFQALQQQIAEQAAEVATARAIVETAVERPSPFLVGCAKIRAGEAAGIVTRIAHQVHGAIGYTDEHVLHRFTTRLWSWRDEFGTEEDWGELVGRQAAEAPELWPFLVEELRTDVPGE
jgi:acyl-CoA dehydrogenase